ncbi:MAG: helix-turn-helix domain-containing protein [Ornithinibacter sp.]
MRMRDLLSMPDFSLTLLHGDEDSLDRPLRLTYSSDLIDPSRYLDGGELVVSGLVWRSCPEDSETYAANLAAAGAAGLAAGEALFGEVPVDVVEAFSRHNLLLFGVPVEVSFTQINEAVSSASSAARGERLEATLGRYRKMLTAVAQGQTLDDLIRGVSVDNDVVCCVLTSTGRHLSTGSSFLLDTDVDQVTRAFLTSHRLPTRVSVPTESSGAAPSVVGQGIERGSHCQYSIFGVGPAFGQRATSWMIVVKGNFETWPASSVDAVSELAAIVQLEQARREETARAGQSMAEELVASVVEGTANRPETVVQLRRAGLDPDEPLAVVVASFGGDQWGEAARSLIDDVARHVGVPVVASGPGGRIVALVQATDPGFPDRLRTALHRLAPSVARTPLAVGISDAAPLSALTGMWEEARHARSLAELRPDAVSVVTSAEVTSHVVLLATVPDDVRRTFAHRVLGPVRAYDDKHDAGLLGTLAAFLACSGSWSRTAEQLHLHVNTVRYRIQRVEELTGRDLSSLEDRVDVFLALRSLP